MTAWVRPEIDDYVKKLVNQTPEILSLLNEQIITNYIRNQKK
jgi:hypothetical protein